MMAHRRRMLMNMASALPPKDTLQNTSWADIAIVAAAGLAAEYWAVGDAKTITFGSSILGETSMAVKIVGFDYDDLENGGKAAISFYSEKLFRSSAAAMGSGQNTFGWTGSNAYATLNNTVLPALVSAIGVGIIKPVKKYTSVGGNGASPAIATSINSIWLPSQFEVDGTTLSEKPADKSTAYPAFTNDASRIKKANTTNSTWFLRSPAVNYPIAWKHVDTTGLIYADSLSTSKYLSFGFCV